MLTSFKKLSKNSSGASSSRSDKDMADSSVPHAIKEYAELESSLSDNVGSFLLELGEITSAINSALTGKYALKACPAELTNKTIEPYTLYFALNNDVIQFSLLSNTGKILTETIDEHQLADESLQELKQAISSAKITDISKETKNALNDLIKQKKISLPALAAELRHLLNHKIVNLNEIASPPLESKAAAKEEDVSIRNLLTKEQEVQLKITNNFLTRQCTLLVALYKKFTNIMIEQRHIRNEKIHCIYALSQTELQKSFNIIEKARTSTVKTFKDLKDTLIIGSTSTKLIDLAAQINQLENELSLCQTTLEQTQEALAQEQELRQLERQEKQAAFQQLLMAKETHAKEMQQQRQVQKTLEEENSQQALCLKELQLRIEQLEGRSHKPVSTTFDSGDRFSLSESERTVYEKRLENLIRESTKKSHQIAALTKELELLKPEFSTSKEKGQPSSASVLGSSLSAVLHEGRLSEDNVNIFSDSLGISKS